MQAGEVVVNEFVAEAREHLSNTECNLLAMENCSAGECSEIVDRLFRSIHSIKGGSGTFGFPAVAISHGAPQKPGGVISALAMHYFGFAIRVDRERDFERKQRANQDFLAKLRELGQCLATGSGTQSEAGGYGRPLIKPPETVVRNAATATKHSCKPVASNQRIELLAIGVSTGGPNALTDLIPLLPSDLGIPLLIVQHMPASMTASLAESLNKKSALEVREAADGEEVLPNVAYIASGGRHMSVAAEAAGNGCPGRRRIQLTSDPPVNSCRPSVDVLFHSLARAYSGRVLAVIMTGMGSDGMDGVRILKKKNCYCISQSEETCVVYGMPRAVVEAGLSDEEVPLDNMAFRILELVRGNNLKGKTR